MCGDIISSLPSTSSWRGILLNTGTTLHGAVFASLSYNSLSERRVAQQCDATVEAFTATKIQVAAFVLQRCVVMWQEDSAASIFKTFLSFTNLYVS
jgi:hypothetical protein